MKSRVLLVAGACIVMILGSAVPAFAHARLLSSQPNGGATIAESPPEIVLNFSERIEASFGGVQVFDAAGARMQSAEPQISGSTVRMSLAPLPAAGDYTVLFRIISGDSHPVESRFAFAYQPPAPQPSPSPGTSPSEPVSPQTPEQASGPRPLDVKLQTAGVGSTVGLWGSRMANYLSMTMVVGLLLTGGVLLNSAGSLSVPQKRLISMAGKWAVLWVVSTLLVFSFGLSVAAALPMPGVLRGGLPARFFETRLGFATVVQAGLAAAIVLVALVANRRGNRGALKAGFVLVLLAALAPGYWGHAGTSSQVAIAMASDWAHVIAITAWVGGLAALVLYVVRSGSDIEVAGPAQRFSRVAGIAVVVVLVTGIINAVLRIRSVGELLSTSWGRLVLLKLVLFGVIAWLGWRNRTRMLPALKGDGVSGRAAFKKMATVELVFMVAAIGTATGLASTIPSDAEAASRIQSIATAFGDNQINLTVDPAAVGPNLMHLYFLDSTGRPLIVSEPAMTLSNSGKSVLVQMFESGPGHYTALAQRIDRAGEYQVAVAARVSGVVTNATGVVTFR